MQKTTKTLFLQILDLISPEAFEEIIKKLNINDVDGPYDNGCKVIAIAYMVSRDKNVEFFIVDFSTLSQQSIC